MFDILWLFIQLLWSIVSLPFYLVFGLLSGGEITLALLCAALFFGNSGWNSSGQIYVVKDGTTSIFNLFTSKK